jgi:hypothetical protein
MSFPRFRSLTTKQECAVNPQFVARILDNATDDPDRHTGSTLVFHDGSTLVVIGNFESVVNKLSYAQRNIVEVCG